MCLVPTFASCVVLPHIIMCFYSATSQNVTHFLCAFCFCCGGRILVPLLGKARVQYMCGLHNPWGKQVHQIFCNILETNQKKNVFPHHATPETDNAMDQKLDTSLSWSWNNRIKCSIRGCSKMLQCGACSFTKRLLAEHRLRFQRANKPNNRHV